MRQAFSRIVIASGLLTLACATALDEGPQAGAIGDDPGGSSGAGGSLSASGSASAGSGAAGATSAGASSSAGGGKGGSGTLAFGGTSTSGGAGTSGGSSGGGSASAGAAAGGAAGSVASAGKSGATGAGGSAGSAGSGSAGATTAACNGVADWTSKTYALGDHVASTCSGVFAGSCPEGQAHEFECNPMAGAAGLPWCQSREPGVGNGWSEAWIDKGQCQ